MGSRELREERGATVSEPDREITARSEFRDIRLKLAPCSLTRVLFEWSRIQASIMKPRFTLFRRGAVFYCEDTTTGQQASLKTKDEGAARMLLHSKNEAFRQPVLNLQIARTYLSATHPDVAKRTWSSVMEELGKTKSGETHRRHLCAMKDKAFDSLRELPILETQAIQFLRVLNAGTVSTNVFLRRLRNIMRLAVLKPSRLLDCLMRRRMPQ